MRALALGAALLCACAPGPGPATGFAVIDRYPGPDGGYDYLSIDADARRLYVAREYGVMSVDLATRAVTAKLVDGGDVSAVLPLPGTRLMLGTNWGSDSATLFDRITGTVVAQIALGSKPDAAVFDPASGQAVVMNSGDASAAFIDITARRVVATVALGGAPEGAVADGDGRVYINIVEPAQVVALDTRTRRIVARYPLAECVEPTGIAFDPRSRLLMSACRSGTVRLLDAATGSPRGAVRTGMGADGALFDAERRLGYVPCKDGTLTVFRLDPQGRPTPVARVATASGARTAALDPGTGRVYLAAAEHSTDAQGREVQVPGTFGILVVGPR
jgi:DNA-binding beta-propeller fold protein YncE